MSHDSEDAYARAGVSYAVLDDQKRNAQTAALRTAGQLARHGAKELVETRGESAYVVDIGSALLATVTEGLGTKNLVADAARAITGRSHYDDIARDTCATILNDLATVGAAPLALTAYWASGSSEWFADRERMSDLVAGWESACATAGCSWGGGETQTIMGIVEPNAVALGGSAVGIIAPKERLLVGSRVAAGDAILMAPATGIHTNGLTLARKLAAELPDGYATKVPGDPRNRSMAEALLDPTPLYGPLVECVQRANVDLHYAVHVTGHGWRKLMRANQALTYVVDTVPAVPPILAALQRWSNMTDAEAYGTFNMGFGFALYVAPAHVDRAIAAASAAGWSLTRVGTIEAGAKRVVIPSKGIEFDGGSLQIR